MSSHDPLTALTAVRSGYLDVLMFSLNPSFDLLPEGTLIEDLFERKTFKQDGLGITNPMRQELYEECARSGVGITVMKALSAGQLLFAEASPFGAPLTVAQCEHYALTRPGVVSALIGCSTMEQVYEMLAYNSLADAEKDYTAILSAVEGEGIRYAPHGNCVYCNHCLPCPQQIDIAAVLKFYDLAKNQLQVPETIMGHYQDLSVHASDCIDCGDCEERCPFDVKIAANMEKAGVLFGI
jgi:hypothetical protein